MGAIPIGGTVYYLGVKMAKNNDVPKDLPILTPRKRPSLEELAKTDQTETVKRVLGTSSKVEVAAFNSSI